MPSGSIREFDKGRIKNPTEFLDFLKGLKFKNDKKKIVLQFDEVELMPSLNNFLHVWGKLFHDRHNNKKLEKYIVIITGSVDLIKATIGETSPFNIAKTHYIQPFSDSESAQLINVSLEKSGIKIDKKAVQRLISEIKGHPLLLQQTCHLLFENAVIQKKEITGGDVIGAIDTLLKQCDNLYTLREDLKLNAILEEKLGEILRGKEVRYLPYKEFSFAGTGPIIEDENGFCTIRNKVYERFLNNIIDVSPIPREEVLPKVFICCSKDMEWKGELLEYFNTERHEILFTWEAQKTKPKKKLLQEIEECIDTADISIFLISEHSLTPYYLLELDFLALLKQKANEGKKIFSVSVPPDVWKNIEKFAEMDIHSKDTDTRKKHD